MFGRYLKKLLGHPPVEMPEDPVRWTPGSGWFPRELAGQKGYPSPYEHKLVRIMSKNWSSPSVSGPRELPAMMNVVGLYWQPAGGAMIDHEPVLAIDNKKPDAP